jgi:thiol-disulfide isomerase/thioredoxin
VETVFAHAAPAAHRSGIECTGSRLSPVMELTLYTSAFCAPCVRARSVLREAGKLLAKASIREVDVPSHLAESEEAGIASTPTLVVRRDGTEVFRASGVPSVQQVLAAAALALE